MNDKYIKNIIEFFNSDMVRTHLTYRDVMVLAVESYVSQQYRLAEILFTIAEKGTSEKEAVLPVTDQIILHLRDNNMTRLAALKIKNAISPRCHAREEGDALLDDIDAVRGFITECKQETKRVLNNNKD